MGKAFLLNICATIFFALNLPAQSFQYIRTVTVQSSQVSNADQTNFPLDLPYTDPGLKSAANGGHVQSATGADISFFSDAALTQLLPFEIVAYNGASGTLSAVVLCSRISHTQNTVFYLAYERVAPPPQRIQPPCGPAIPVSITCKITRRIP
jgi:hypothetical protein